MIQPISEYIHFNIIKKLKKYNIKTVLDMGGTGKLKNKGFEVKNANIKQKIDATDLPFENGSFDATVSIATLEHVGNIEKQKKFIYEAIRVAKKISLHWFPFGIDGEIIEKFKTELGHIHPCIVPDDRIDKYLQTLKVHYSFESFMRVGEHLLLLATMYPKLNKPKLYNFIYNNKSLYLGTILEIIKL